MATRLEGFAPDLPPAVPRDFYGEAAPGAPTDAPPGSRRKIRVLAHRAARGLPLFHPRDAGAGLRLAYAIVKNPGPHGEKSRGVALRELAEGAVEC